MYKSILVPVDLSDLHKGKTSLKLAQQLSDEGGKIKLLNVVENIPAYVAAELPAGLMEQSKTESLEKLEAIATEANGRIDVAVRTGHPNTAILTAAEDAGADLIIIGSHRPGLQDYLLGSTAGRVVRHSPCSVLVVR